MQNPTSGRVSALVFDFLFNRILKNEHKKNHLNHHEPLPTPDVILTQMHLETSTTTLPPLGGIIL